MSCSSVDFGGALLTNHKEQYIKFLFTNLISCSDTLYGALLRNSNGKTFELILFIAISNMCDVF